MRTTLTRAAARRTLPVILLALVVPLAAAALVGAGCGSGSGGDSGGDASQPSLEGTSWRLTGWSVSSLDPADFTITAKFADGRIGGTSAVNTYGGPYEAGEDGAFSVGELVSTMMAGPEPDMRAETIYLELLAEAKQYAVEGETLTLSDAGGNQSLIFAAGE
jgi:heat shock protein HslJ